MNLNGILILFFLSKFAVKCQTTGHIYTSDLQDIDVSESTEMVFLSDMLKTMKIWNCPQFKKECENPTFDFTDFTKLLYLHTCNHKAFVENCSSTVNEYVYNKQRYENILQENRNIQPINLTTNYIKRGEANKSKLNTEWKELRNYVYAGLYMLPAPPCLQVALLDISSPNDSYFEIHHVYVPLCSLLWCGMNEDTAKRHQMSLWDCMSTSCHRSFIFLFCLIGMLSLLITWTNGTAVVVFLRNKDLRNSQGIYKLSMALADTIVGVFVLPSMAITLSRVVFKPRFPYDQSQEVIVDLLFRKSTNNVTLELTDEKDLFHEDVFFLPAITREYANVVGFCSTMAFVASIHSLTVGSIDRLLLLFNPLKYNASLAKKHAIWAITIVWVIAVSISSLPFVFWKDLNFGIFGSSLITVTGMKSIYLCTASLLVPILVMWIATILTGYYLHKHARQREAQSFDCEHRLTRTFILMVVIFSLSLIPTILLVFLYFLYPLALFGDPTSFNVRSSYYFSSWEFVSVIALVCNSCWNFFIYIARNEGFRKETKKLYNDIRFLLGIAVSQKRFRL